MKLVTWNVNSIRQRQAHVLDWLATHEPDVLALQELKLETDRFPAADFAAAGYHALVHGQKTYNGVALLSRAEGGDVHRDLPGLADGQSRVIAASYGDVRVINVYVPNGQSVGSDKYRYKLDWYDALTAWVRQELVRHPRLAVVGDFNVAPEDRDVHDPEAWREQVLCSTPERDKLRALLDLGLKDAFRLFEQPPKTYSWWDYRQLALQRNHGLRIDLILVSAALAAGCTAVTIDKAARKLPKPSDHAPVIAEL